VCDASAVCSECHSGYKLLSSVCTYNREGYRLTTNTNVMEACFDGNCAECTAVTTTCTKCKTDYYLSGASCVTCTDSGNFKVSANPDTCTTLCTTDCTTCATVSTCSVCGSGKKVKISDGTCMTCSGGNLAIVGDYCYDSNECTTNCQKCATATTCDTCSSGNYKKADGTCAVCSTINAECATCSDEKTCLTCSNSKVPIFPYTSCVASCGTGYYSSTFNSNNVCDPCPDNCDACSSSTVCTTCKTGYLKAVPGDYCVSTSDCSGGLSCYEEDGTTCVISETLCENCSIDNCETCLVSGKCLKCSEGFYVRKSDSSACVETCNSITQLIVSDYCYAAADCGVSNCLKCGSRNTCASGQCASGFFLLNSGQCSACDTDCTSCQDKSTCTVCGNSKLLQNGKCVSSCTAGYYTGLFISFKILTNSVPIF
jgi:hypothetical protein